MVKSISLWVIGALLLSCGSMKSPGGVADRFMDKYYVESDQQAALPLAGGLALLRLQTELKLVGGARAGIAQGSHAAKVFYQRTGLAEADATATVDYALTIKPQGGSDLTRAAHLELARQADGTWRVLRFSETTQR